MKELKDHPVRREHRGDYHPWNPVKELKGAGFGTVGKIRTVTWNPVKELKVSDNIVCRGNGNKVESGEGIER